MKELLFLDHFKDLKDPRIARKMLYPMREILILTLSGMVAGCDSWEDLEDFGKQKVELLRTFGGFENGTPSDDTLRRFFRALDPQVFQKCFAQWMQSFQIMVTMAESLHKEQANKERAEELIEPSEEEKYKVIAIDGKVSRGSHDHAVNQSAIHTVSAFAAEQRLVLGQRKVNDKSNEITAIPELLDLIDIEGAVVTIDAMGCQKAIANKILEKKGHFVFGLKGNQSALYEDVKLFFQDTFNISMHEDIDKGHGRIEIRQCYVSSNIEWLQKRHPEWHQINSIIMIKSEREIKGVNTMESRFYISDLHDTIPEKMLFIIRSHWAIENSLHWILDVSFGEDQSRIRKGNAPQNMAIIRHVALNLLQSYKSQHKRSTIKRLRKMAGWSANIMFDILQQQF